MAGLFHKSANLIPIIERVVDDDGVQLRQLLIGDLVGSIDFEQGVHGIAPGHVDRPLLRHVALVLFLVVFWVVFYKYVYSSSS